MLSLTEIDTDLSAGRLDPVALTEEALEAARAHPFGSRIYARLTPDRARREAEAARKRAQAGTRKGPLDGVPLSWKDLFDTAGIATEAGSALLKDCTPTEDAAVLARLSAQGTVCLGKTHMSELAYSGLGFNPVTATTPCVNDSEAVSGGSSSGAAGSVAFGLAPAALGSDTGGSVRTPAAWNDLVGLKTTAGALPMAGTVPLSRLFDTIGPLTQSVEDAALLWGGLSGTRAPDLRGATLHGARLLVLESALAETEAAPLNAFDAAVTRLAHSGARVTRAALDTPDAALALAPTLFGAETWAVWGEEIDARGELLFPEIRTRFCAGRDIPASAYLRARHQLDQLRARYAAETAGYDAVLLPTVPILPPRLEALSDSATYQSRNLMALRNTRIGNLLGLCALTLPTGTPSCGLMLLAAPHTEARLLRLGRAAEAALI